MDFSLLEKHPWITTGAIAGGGFLLYLVLRNRSGNAAVQTAATGVTTTTLDPTAAALDAQQMQTQAQLQAISLSGSNQVDLAQISATVANNQTAAQQEVTDTQTAASLALGTATLNAQYGVAALQAGVQTATLNALVAAFGGNQGGGNPVQSTVTDTATGSTTTVAQHTAPVPVYIATPPAPPPIATAPITSTTFTPTYTPAPGDQVIPGGSPLISAPSYIPVGAWPDSGVVAQNTQTEVTYLNDQAKANNINNYNQCISNANLSQGYPNFTSLIDACHANYGV